MPIPSIFFTLICILSPNFSFVKLVSSSSVFLMWHFVPAKTMFRRFWWHPERSQHFSSVLVLDVWTILSLSDRTASTIKFPNAFLFPCLYWVFIIWPHLLLLSTPLYSPGKSCSPPHVVWQLSFSDWDFVSFSVCVIHRRWRPLAKKLRCGILPQNRKDHGS